MKEKHLVVVGNGFDIAHGIPSKYEDYYEFLKNTNNETQIDTLESIFKKHKNINLWKNFEEALAFPDSKGIEDLKNIVGDLEPGLYKEIIDETFDCWLRELPSYSGGLDKNHPFNNYIDIDNFYITFNYTNTLEDVHDCKRVLHLHGQASFQGNETNEKLFYGHKHIKTKNELVNITEKPVKKILSMKKDAICAFAKNVTGKVVVMGFSYSQVDIPYLLFIRKILPKANWIMFYYNYNDLKALKKCAKKLKLNKKEFEIKSSKV